MTLLTDLRGNVKHREQRLNRTCESPYERMGAALERKDFHEQFTLAPNEAEQIDLCKRWLNSYQVIWNAEKGS